MATALPSIVSLLSGLNTLQRAIADFEAGLVSTASTKKSSDNKVTVVASAQGRIVSITIDVSLISAGDNVALASTVKSVANSALAAAVASGAAKAVTFAQGLALPGLPAYGAPQPDYAGFAASVNLVSQTAIANSPCKKARSFSCDSGPAHVTVSSDKVISTLTIDAPLSEDVSFLQASLVDAINCANGKATNPPDDIHDGVTGVVGTTVTFETLVLYANGSINTGPNLQLKGAGCQGFGNMANAAAPGTGPQGTVIGQSSGFGNILSRPAVVIGGLTHLHGYLKTENTLTADSTVIIDGGATQNTAVVAPELSLSTQFPATVAPALNVAAGATATATPKYYSSIKLNTNARLNVSGGVYYMNSLELQTGSKIIVNASNGPVIFWIRDSFIFKGALTDAANVFPRIWVGYLGTTTVSLDTPFQGSLVAPNAQITLSTVGNPNHQGSFHGRHLQVGPGQTICHHPFEIPFQLIPGRVP